MNPFAIIRILIPFVLPLATGIANAETIGCVTTAWKLIGANQMYFEPLRDSMHDIR
jgi:catabolite regulation protein CreA